MGLGVAGAVLKHKKPGSPNYNNDWQGNRSTEGGFTSTIWFLKGRITWKRKIRMLVQNANFCASSHGTKLKSGGREWVLCEASPAFTERCILSVESIYMLGYLRRSHLCLYFKLETIKKSEQSSSPKSAPPLWGFQNYREFTALSSKLSMLKLPAVSKGYQ